MVYVFADRLDTLGPRMEDVNSEQVTYRRGTDTVNLNACPIKIDAQELIPGVAVTQVQYQDFVFDAADLILAGSPTYPQHGDQIERTNGDKFQVVSLGEGPPYEFTTSTRKRVRVHTEQVE